MKPWWLVGDDPLLRSSVVLRIMEHDPTVTHAEFTDAPTAPD